MAWPRVYRDRADAIEGLGRIYNIDLNIGLFLLLSGHGLMIVAFFGVVIQLIAEFLSLCMMASLPATAATPPTELPEASAA